ncbi:hypothetical protein [Gordonia westfalica]|uniref:Uncharacterized protein n=1 Tax=Gordonia westfalica TaxID=158898 RepID=A0A1H2JHY8_9ACTN|nr:hypothetical protein [Gordonia westfalica]SDU56050.1 hypothetical protein SAMN04488548_1342153 [Gordonia westfalica]
MPRFALTAPPPRSAPRRASGHRVALVIALVAAVMSLNLLAAPGAGAATTTTLKWNTSSITYNIVNGVGFGAGVNFKLGSHKTRNLTLFGRYSWGWNRALNGQTLPSTWKNQYHVRFLDAAGKAVWTQYNSIPNGGKRTYSVGSNVRTIQVTAGTNKDPYGRPRVVAVGPGVAYESS